LANTRPLEFKPQYCQRKKKKEERREEERGGKGKWEEGKEIWVKNDTH
jgi:hypothetical protein